MFSLNFEGYWVDQMAFAIPQKPGIFLVYRGEFDEMKREVRIEDLIYIGEADNVKEGILSHELRSDWQAQRGSEKETLVYAFSEVEGMHRSQICAALIYRHRPTLNLNDQRYFPYGTTTLLLEGRCAFLSSIFTVPGGGHELRLRPRRTLFATKSFGSEPIRHKEVSA